MVKLRIISDTHFDTGINGLDYNKKGIRHSSFGHYFYKSLLQDFDGITLIAGDLASSVKNTNLFLEGFFKDKPVIFIQGNHSYYQKTTKSIYEITQELRETFPITHAFWKFLENEWIWIPGTNNQVAIIGSCFYTDYKYKTFTLESYNEYKKSWHNVLKAWRCIPVNEEYIPTKRLTAKKILDENIILAEDGLNDFKWGKDENGIKITPHVYIKLNNLAKEKIKDCYNEILSYNPNAKVILMTHHALSPKCIDERFKNSNLNASYVSDLEKWLEKEFPNLRLIISGHLHTRKDFVFSKDKKRYVINACGYIKYDEPFKGDIKFNPNFIIDTDDL